MQQQDKKRKALITGSSGFLGTYLYNSLAEKYNVFTLGRKSVGNTEHITADLKNEVPMLFDHKYSIVVHNAGKAHIVPKTKEESDDFFHVNLEGTKNLLTSLENLSVLPESFVFISTVAVYGLETGDNIPEDAPLHSKEPYGLSKIQAEEIIKKWGIDNDVRISVLRLPLVIGKSAPGNLGSMIKAIKKGYYFNIGKGVAKRSMVLAEDVANIIEMAAQAGGVYNLTDGKNPTYGEISGAIGAYLNKKVMSMPVPIARNLARVLDILEKIIRKKLPFSTRTYEKMTSSLTFSDLKAREKLNWNPQAVIKCINKFI